MFKKLVSSLPFSPALVGQLGFYAKRLKKEEATRKLGLVFTVLALIVQSFAILTPPESANASNPSNMIPGGVTSTNNIVANYDANTNNIKDLLSDLGITRAEVAATKLVTVNSKRDGVLSWGLTSRFSAAQGEKTYSAPVAGGSRTWYYRPLVLSDTLSYTIANGSSYPMYQGYSSKFGWFAIMKSCGNLITKTAPAPYPCPANTQGAYPSCTPIPCPTGTTGTYPNCITPPAPPKPCAVNPALNVNSPDCQPCPDSPSLWLKDVKCKPEFVRTKVAKNITQGNVDATTVTAQASDKITYSLTIENKGTTSADETLVEKIDDVLEYARVIDNGGGALSKDPSTNVSILTWPKFTVKPGEKITRMFTIQLLDTIPAMGQGISDQTSYDCKMINTYGNSVQINVRCPVEKQVIENTVAALPHTGPRENMIFAAIVLAVVVYFYARTRQLKTEVRLIRRDFNTGTI